MKKPSCLKCFGLCYKTSLRRFQKAFNFKERILGKNTLNGELTQLGGAFIVNSKGEILFQRLESYMGDHISSEDLIYQFDCLLNKYIINNDDDEKDGFDDIKSESIDKSVKSKSNDIGSLTNKSLNIDDNNQDIKESNA